MTAPSSAPAFLEPQDEPDQLAFIQSCLAQVGFDYLDYLQRYPFPLTSPKFHHLCTIPEDLVARQHRPLFHEAIIKSVLGQKQWLIWASSDFYRLCPALATRGAPAFYGLFVPGTCVLGNTASVLTLVRRRPPVTPTELTQRRQRLLATTFAVHYVAQRILARRHRERQDFGLSRQQTDILKWVADGKSNDDIARILGISGNTVHYHMNQILNKTGTAHRVNAAICTLVAGCLRL